MDLPEYLQGLSFRFVQPAQSRSLAARAAAAVSRLGLPLDAFNTRLPFGRSEMGARLRGTRVGATPLAVRAIVNRGVSHLGDREAFVAFGLGAGDSLLAAIAGNREKFCVGVQDCVASPPSTVFERRFSELSNAECHFVAVSFEQCTMHLDDRSIGLCFVSAESHEPVAGRLVECEPRLAENAFLLVENGNCERTRQAAFEFVAASRNQYRLLADLSNSEPCSLTWGRGLLAMQLLGRNAVAHPRSQRATSPVLVPAA